VKSDYIQAYLSWPCC